MTIFSDNPDKLQSTLDSFKSRWNIHTTNYIKTYPDWKMNINTVPNERALAAVMKTMSDIRIMDASLTGKVNVSGDYIESINKKIKTVKDKYGKEKINLDSVLSNNVAGKPLKIDKYDENSQSYIYTSYYTIGILTMFFFIYKQLNQ
tara:strand:+ start:345 stop:785 length:441 start_codon:yes stop_codon:yes gene_type:complete